MKHTTLLLLAALLTSPALADGPPPPTAAAAYAVPVSRLTPGKAFRLGGRRRLFALHVEALDWVGNQLACRCKAPSGLLGVTACMRTGQRPTREMVVEATLDVLVGEVRLGRVNRVRIMYFLDDAVRK